MFNRKRHAYRKVLDELENREGILYRPLVWSTWGRMHPEAQVILKAMSVQAARRHGLRDHRLVLRRTCAAVGVQLMRRAVGMLRACIPSLHAAEEQLLFDEAGASAFEVPRTRPVSLVGGDAGAQ